MKQFKTKILTASVLIALASASSAWAEDPITVTAAASLGQGNSAIQGGGSSTIGAISDTYARDGGVAANGGSATSTDTKANDGGVAANGGSATSTVDHSKADNGSASTNVGNASATNNTSSANGDGSAATNAGNATSQYFAFQVPGSGNAITGIGDATSTYKVNNQELTGTVTGNPTGIPTTSTQLTSIPFGNSIDHSIVGNAGVTQTFQNSGTGLAQQSILVDGTVNVTNSSSNAVHP